MMSERDLAYWLAEEADCSEATAARVLEALREIVLQALLRGRPIRLPGLCQFHRVYWEGRQARNPITGARYPVAGKWSARCIVSPSIRARVNACPPMGRKKHEQKLLYREK